MFFVIMQAENENRTNKRKKSRLLNRKIHCRKISNLLKIYQVGFNNCKFKSVQIKRHFYFIKSLVRVGL